MIVIIMTAVFHLSAEAEITPKLHAIANYRTNCFELFGCDVILDKHLEPHLLEASSELTKCSFASRDFICFAKATSIRSSKHFLVGGCSLSLYIYIIYIYQNTTAEFIEASHEFHIDSFRLCCTLSPAFAGERFPIAHGVEPAGQEDQRHVAMQTYQALSALHH